MRAVFLLSLLLVGTVLSFGCVQPTTPPVTPSPSGGAQTHTIVMQNFSFAPNQLPIKAGDSVKWTNNDAASHTVTIPSMNIDKTLDSGQSTTIQFPNPGTYNYNCRIHPSMTGVITVTS